MTDQPLNSDEQIKIVIFALLLLTSIVFLAGIIPSIFLLFGLYMMKKDGNFSHIETATKYCKIYFHLALVGCMVITAISGYFFYFYQRSDAFFIFLILSCIAIAYSVALTYLFYKPLSNHKDWVASNGIFSNKKSVDLSKKSSPDIDIIKGEKHKSYSVADELLKWAKLKEDGAISEDDYNQAKAKLLAKA